jgi:hypothetical protein
MYPNDIATELETGEEELPDLERLEALQEERANE